MSIDSEIKNIVIEQYALNEAAWAVFEDYAMSNKINFKLIGGEIFMDSVNNRGKCVREKLRDSTGRQIHPVMEILNNIIDIQNGIIRAEPLTVHAKYRRPGIKIPNYKDLKIAYLEKKLEFLSTDNKIREKTIPNETITLNETEEILAPVVESKSEEILAPVIESKSEEILALVVESESEEILAPVIESKPAEINQSPILASNVISYFDTTPYVNMAAREIYNLQYSIYLSGKNKVVDIIYKNITIKASYDKTQIIYLIQNLKMIELHELLCTFIATMMEYSCSRISRIKIVLNIIRDAIVLHRLNIN